MPRVTHRSPHQSPPRDLPRAGDSRSVTGAARPIRSTPSPGPVGLDAATAAATSPAASGVDVSLVKAGIDARTLHTGARDLFGLAAASPAPAATTPSIGELYHDPRFEQLYAFVTARMRTLQNEHKGWDKMWQIRGFAEALRFVLGGTPLGTGTAVEPLFHDFTAPQERRAIAHLLLLLMPEEWRTERPMTADGRRGPAQSLFEPFPDSLIARADDGFELRPGDLPHTAPIFTRHLTEPDLLHRIFRRGQQGIFLASKAYCPGAFLQDRRDINPPSKPTTQQVGHEGDPIFVHVEDVIERGGRRLAKCRVPPQHKTWLDGGGNVVRGEQVFAGSDVVLNANGSPKLDANGAPEPILIPVEHLADYLLDPGPNRAGLDSSREDDRALALAYSHGLRSSYLTDQNGITKSLFDWLQEADERTPATDIERIKSQVREVAWNAVARHACHPRRTHFKLDLGADAWQREAYEMLTATGIMQDCGNRYEKDKSTTADVHELAWTAHFLERGFVGGSLDCYGLARAYDRLAATFLAPLGIVGTTDLAEGHGSELVRTLSNPDAEGVVQVGVPLKSKLNEMIVGLDARLSSGRGPAAHYMENWPGYLRIDGASGSRYDFRAAGDRLRTLERDYA